MRSRTEGSSTTVDGAAPRDMPQRMAEDTIPYQGPLRVNQRDRMRRILIGMTLFLVAGLLFTVIVWLAGPIR